MRAIGNLIWFVFGGVLMGLAWWFAGLVAYLSIIGIPWGKACFVIGQFTFLPFGREAVSRADLSGRTDIGTGILGTIGNIIWFSVAALGLAVAACTGEQQTAGVIVSDSAGVEIVTNQQAFTDVTIRTVSGEPTHQIIDEILYEVSVVRPLADGRLAVGVNGSGSVLIFDSGGDRVSELGRPGDGPGEFRSIQSLVPLPGDSLGVYDPLLRRFTVFPLSGGEPRTVSLGEVAPRRGWSRVHPLEGGLALVGEAGLAGRGDSGIYRNSAESLHIDLTGEAISTYGEFPGLEAVWANGMVGRAAFGALLATATVGDQLVVGTGEHPELRVFGPNGDLERIVRWSGGDRTVTQARMDRFVEFQLSLGPPEQANAMRDRLASMPFAPEMPTLVRVMPAPDGSLWVGEYPGPEAEAPPGRRLAPLRWVVFTVDGAMRERIETPLGYLPMALTENLVWGVYYDELGVESVRAYPTGIRG